MESVLILLVMGASLWGLLWLSRWWMNQRQRRKDALSSIDTQELNAMVDSFKGAHAASRGSLMALLVFGVVISTALGALLISVMASGSQETTRPKVHRKTAGKKPVSVPEMMRPALKQHRVVIVITEDGAEAGQDVLDACDPGQVVHYRLPIHGGVQCLDIDSPAAKALMAPKEDEFVPDVFTPKVMRQGMAPSVGKNVSKRKGILQRYAEIVYFLSTFLGVVLRFTWDHSLERRRCEQAGETASRFDLMNLVVGFFIGVAVHLLMSKAMGVGYETTTFQNVLLASYNGFLWPSILKDVSEFRELRKGGVPA